jgi:prepilin-type N-terminal cleavage/methylation domain-containing protein
MRRGYTLIELMITLGVVVVLSAVVTVGLFGSRSQADLKDATQQAAALLREAQSDTMAQEGGVSWGVHFENATATPPFYALFSSSTYSTATVVSYYRLPASVAYATATLAQGAWVNVTFSSPSGAAAASATIRLYSRNTAAFSSTIYIAPTGAISY